MVNDPQGRSSQGGVAGLPAVWRPQKTRQVCRLTRKRRRNGHQVAGGSIPKSRTVEGQLAHRFPRSRKGQVLIGCPMRNAIEPFKLAARGDASNRRTCAGYRPDRTLRCVTCIADIKDGTADQADLFASFRCLPHSVLRDGRWGKELQHCLRCPRHLPQVRSHDASQGILFRPPS